MKRRAALAVTGCLLGIAGPARADQTISSPLLPWSGQLACYVRNVGKTPVTVNVQLFGSDAIAITPTFDDCNDGPLASGVTCVLLRDAPPTIFTAACSATTSGRAKNLRGTLEMRYGPSNNVRIAEELW
jgi:hypothetical protein